MALRNETEASSSTLTFSGIHHIIKHTFRLYKCACANTKVGVVAKVQMHGKRIKVRTLFSSRTTYCIICILEPIGT